MKPKRCQDRFRIFLLLLVLAMGCRSMEAQDSYVEPIVNGEIIKISGIGFLPGEVKQATVPAAESPFSIIRYPGGEVVYTGDTVTVDENLSVADFSGMRKAGSFILEVPGLGQSAPFIVEKDVFRKQMQTVTEAFYLWRCGTAVHLEHNGDTFAHEACHLNDAWLDDITGQHERKDATGGWHDAGDYNKYTVNAAITLGVMLLAWEQNQSKLEKLDLRIPESGNDLPDFLAEIKWELDWLLKMAYPDGSGKISHKISRREFSPTILPEEDAEDRFFVPWSSAGTGGFAAVCAKASRIYEPYDPDYAMELLSAARLSYQCLKEHPDNVPADQRGFKTGEYATRDWDDRLWAAAELWESTGEDGYLKDFEERARRAGNLMETVFDWSDVKNLALITYVRSKRDGREQKMYNAALGSLYEAADEISDQAKAHPYARTLGEDYFWGCNGAVARQVVMLMSAYEMTDRPEFKRASIHAIDYLFGRNPYGRSYVTGLGYHPPMTPHDRRSSADSVEAPWPGYLVGGAEQADGWVDEKGNFRVNEIAINWNSALVYALSCFIAEEGE